MRVLCDCWHNGFGQRAELLEPAAVGNGLEGSRLSAAKSENTADMLAWKSVGI